MNETISVLICAYNAERTIWQCVRSAMLQKVQPLEVIVINDGSKDKTAKLLNKLQEQYPKVRIIHQENQGIAAARNRAIAAAKGDWIFFLDSDDRMAPEALKNLTSAIPLNNSDIIVGAHQVKRNSLHYKVGVRKTTVLSGFSAMKELLKDRRIKNYVWGKLIRRSLFEQVHFIEGHLFEDVAIIAELFEKAKTITIIPDVVYTYYTGHKGSISNGLKPEILEDMIIAFEQQSAFILNHYPQLLKQSRSTLQRCYLLVILSCLWHQRTQSLACRTAEDHLRYLLIPFHQVKVN